MKRLVIVKAGSTFDATAKQFGDFDTWILAGLGSVGVNTCVVDIENGAALPSVTDCAGVIVTGSHAMVTENLPWSVRLESWIPSLLEESVPFLGICYGHQLLAQCMGGQVGFHPDGKEFGTVEIRLLPDYTNDALFQLFPQRFFVHATHSQTVLRLPPGAICLAANDHEPNHSFRIGDCAWGVQFHPEYDAAIMRSYTSEQADELESAGDNVHEILQCVMETPIAAKIPASFASIVKKLHNQ